MIRFYSMAILLAASFFLFSTETHAQRGRPGMRGTDRSNAERSITEQSNTKQSKEDPNTQPPARGFGRGARGGRGAPSAGSNGLQSRFGSSASRDGSNALFDALDTNKDGVISRDEIEEAVQAFAKLDENKDGKLSRKEMPERMQRMLDRGDSNKDGALDRDELKKMFEAFRQSASSVWDWQKRLSIRRTR